MLVNVNVVFRAPAMLNSILFEFKCFSVFGEVFFVLWPASDFHLINFEIEQKINQIRGRKQ